MQKATLIMPTEQHSERETKEVGKVSVNKRGVATKEGLETIAQRLVRLRKERGITQAQMARALGISQPVVSDYERGALRLHGELILKVAEILGVSADELLGRDGQQKKSRAQGKVQQVFEEVSRLPRRQQEKIVEFVTAFVRQYEQAQK
jgi:transcriptional regulator with XRE-family HTH domain